MKRVTVLNAESYRYYIADKDQITVAKSLAPGQLTLGSQIRKLKQISREIIRAVCSLSTLQMVVIAHSETARNADVILGSPVNPTRPQMNALRVACTSHWVHSDSWHDFYELQLRLQQRSW